MRSVFWDDHVRDTQDPEYAREFAAESVRINTIDTIVNALDRSRVEAGLTKADLARAAGYEPAVVRRLLSSSTVNPTLGTLAEVAAALGMKVVLEPMTPQEREASTVPMRVGIGV